MQEIIIPYEGRIWTDVGSFLLRSTGVTKGRRKETHDQGPERRETGTYDCDVCFDGGPDCGGGVVARNVVMGSEFGEGGDADNAYYADAAFINTWDLRDEMETRVVIG
jgi:hypothetical protein